MDSAIASDFWCDLDSIRYVIEHNPGSIVILVAVVGFLFVRFKKFLIDFLIFLAIHAPIGSKTKERLKQCAVKRDEHEQYECVDHVARGSARRAFRKISWVFELFLNLTAIALVVLGGLICYLLVSPPLACSIAGGYDIYVPAIFKKIHDKGGELLYVDESNRSFLRIWPGKNDDVEPSLDDLMQRYKEKRTEASKLMAPGTAIDPDFQPTESHRYFVLSWRDRDNFDVYFVSRLARHANGKTYIDSFEISSPVHGNALVAFDYNLLFCSFVTPSADTKPAICPRL